MGYGFLPHNRPVDVDIARATIWSDPFMTLNEKAKLSGVFASSGAPGSRLVTQNDIARGLTYAGMGYIGASFAGKVLGSVFGVSTSAQEILSQTGAVYAGMKGLRLI